MKMINKRLNLLKNRCKQVTLNFWFLFSYLFISMQALADGETINRDFHFFIERVEKLQKTNVTDALLLLDKHQMNIEALSAENQVKYYQVLSEIYIETSQYKLGRDIASQGLRITQPNWFCHHPKNRFRAKLVLSSVWLVKNILVLFAIGIDLFNTV